MTSFESDSDSDTSFEDEDLIEKYAQLCDILESLNKKMKYLELSVESLSTDKEKIDIQFRNAKLIWG